MITRRWKKAQEAERKYWQSSIAVWSNENRRRYWQEKLKHGFNIDYDFFRNKNVLEIGCGPSGIIFQITQAKSRVAIEPMDLNNFIDKDWKNAPVVKGFGEELPFNDKSFDIVLCFNALDHSHDPEKIIQEAHRVLLDDGDFLLWIYTLRDECRPLQGILNKLDPPHPNHFTFDEVIAKVNHNSFDIKKKKCDKSTGLPNDTIKKIFGNIMMNTAWVWSKKV
jgi:ubiquinone/menaquinone biosynthesis C-methylase UbiE